MSDRVYKTVLPVIDAFARMHRQHGGLELAPCSSDDGVWVLRVHAPKYGTLDTLVIPAGGKHVSMGDCGVLWIWGYLDAFAMKLEAALDEMAGEHGP